MIKTEPTMKSVTVQLSSLVSQFAAHQTDFLWDYGKDDPEAQEDNVETFIKDIRNLLSPKRDLVISTLRRLFSEGFTYMLLAREVFEVLETADAQDEDFSVIVKDGKETVCILCKAELVW
jgi:translation initiation factor 2B subunit (eIF-2B alpha/beta/delta family)